MSKREEKTLSPYMSFILIPLYKPCEKGLLYPLVKKLPTALFPQFTSFSDSGRANLHVNVILVLWAQLLARRRYINVIWMDHETAGVANILWGPFVSGPDAIALALKRAKTQHSTKNVMGKLIHRRIQAHCDTRYYRFAAPIPQYLAIETDIETCAIDTRKIQCATLVMTVIGRTAAVPNAFVPHDGHSGF